MTSDVQADNQGDVTAAIAEFARSVPVVDMPEEAIEGAKVHILDTLGVAFAGSVSDVARIVREDISAQGLSGQGSAIIGTSLSAPPRFAAFANATAIHADNFDDTTPQSQADRTGGIHASAAVLPVVLAEGQAIGALSLIHV